MRISVLNQEGNYITEFWGFEFDDLMKPIYRIYGECNIGKDYLLGVYYAEQEAKRVFARLLSHMDNNPNLIFRMPQPVAPRVETNTRQSGIKPHTQIDVEYYD